MKNLLFWSLLLLSTSVFSQVVEPCDLDDTVLDQSANAQNLPTSDSRFTLLADDFTLTTTRSVNSVCIVGQVDFYLGGGAKRGISTRENQCNVETLIVSYFPHNAASGLPLNVPLMSFNIIPTITPLLNAPLAGICTISGTHAPFELAANTYWVSMSSSSAVNSACILRVAAPFEQKVPARGDINERMAPGYAVIPQNGDSPQLILTGGSGFSVAVGALPAAAIPTLSEWGLIILAMAILIFGVSFIKRSIEGMVKA